jgi:hypothetical protein
VTGIRSRIALPVLLRVGAPRSSSFGPRREKFFFAQLSCPRQQLTTGRHVERAHMEGRVLVGRCKPGCDWFTAQCRTPTLPRCHLPSSHRRRFGVVVILHIECNARCGRVLWGTEVLALRSTVGTLQRRSLPKAISARPQRTDGRARLSISLDEAVAPCSFQCAAHSSRLFH